MANLSQFHIEARSFGILGFASHDYWALVDANGDTIEELHGFATNPKTGEFVSLGSFGDELWFYDHPMSIWLETDYRDSVDIYSGSESDVMAVWNKAVNLIPYLNSRHVPYTPLGTLSYPVWNSNSAYRLFGSAMGVSLHNISGRWEPGIDSDLVNADQVEILSHWYNLPLRYLENPALNTF